MTKTPVEQDIDSGHAETQYQTEQVEAEMNPKYYKDVTVLVYLLKAHLRSTAKKHVITLGKLATRMRSQPSSRPLATRRSVGWPRNRSGESGTRGQLDHLLQSLVLMKNG